MQRGPTHLSLLLPWLLFAHTSAELPLCKEVRRALLSAEPELSVGQLKAGFLCVKCFWIKSRCDPAQNRPRLHFEEKH